MSTRRRRSYIEEHAEELAQGKPIESTANAPELDELDKADVQEKILHPPTIDVTKLDGTVVACKTEFGPADLYKRQVLDVLEALSNVFTREVIKMSADFDLSAPGWFDRNKSWLALAAKRLNVQLMTIDCINVLGSTSVLVDEFDKDALIGATVQFFLLYLKQLAEVQKHAKNAQIQSA